jgi:anaerobic selenocysteine-containing dehydrogenase
MGCLAEEITTPGDGQIKALITIAGNPVLSAPNGPQLSDALGQLELMVSVTST